LPVWKPVDQPGHVRGEDFRYWQHLTNLAECAGSLVLDNLVIKYQSVGPMDTITEIRAQLCARRGQWPVICRDTGLNYHWITKFAQGKIEDPSATKISRLSTHLATLPPLPSAAAGEGAPNAADQAEHSTQAADAGSESASSVALNT